MDNLKKKRDYENSKLMEKCEDFNEKLDNLEKLHNYKNFKNCFKKWKDHTKQKKKEDLDNLAKKLNDVLKNKENRDKIDGLNKINNKAKDEEKKLNDKIKKFQEKNAKNKFMKDLIKAHRLNKMLNNAKNKIDKRNKRDAFEKLKYDNNIGKGADKLRKLLEKKMKKDTLDDMKTMDFVHKLDDLINKHNDKVNNDAKKQFLDNLNDLINKKKLRDKLRKWKDFNDEMKNRNKILNKLKRHKLNELRKKEEEEKKKLAISSGVNDFELIGDKKEEEKKLPNKDNQIFISSSQNDINIKAEPTPASQFVLSHAGQNFSFIPPVITKFEFDDHTLNSKTIDKNIIPKQLEEVDQLLKNKLNNDEGEDKFKKILNNLIKINNNKNLREYFDRWRKAIQQDKQNNLNDFAEKLNDILRKAKKESDDILKKDVFDKLKKNNYIGIAGEQLEHILNHKLKKDALDELKKIKNISKGVDKLEKLLKLKPKRDFLYKLIKKNDIANAVNELEKLINKKLKEDAFNTLKKNAGMSEGFRILDKLYKDEDKKNFFDELKKRTKISKAKDKLKELMDKKLKKKALDKIKYNSDPEKAIEDLDKLLLRKYKKKFLDNLLMNKNINKLMDSLNKYVNNNSKKQFFEKLRRKSDLINGIQNLEKIFKEKVRKNTLEEFKKFNHVGIGTNKLEKLINNKLKKKFLDKLKINNNIKNGCNKLGRFINHKLKKDTFNFFKKTNNITKAVHKLNKLIKDKNDKAKKDTFDELKKCHAIAKATNNLQKLISGKLKKDIFDKLKKNDNISKAAEKLKKLINKKLKDDTFKKLKTMDFVDILKDVKKKHDNNVKNEKLKKLMNNLKKIQKDSKEKDKEKLKKYFDHWKNIKELRDLLQGLKDYQNKKLAFNKWKETRNKGKIKDILVDKAKKAKIKEALDYWKDITDRGKIKDALVNKAKIKKALDHWKNIKEIRDILDGLKKKKYFNKWLDKCETKEIFHAFKNLKKKKYLHKLKDQVDRDKFLEKFKDLINKKKLKKNLDKWKELKNKKNILDKLIPYKKKENDDYLKKYFEIWKYCTEVKVILRKTKKKKILLHIIRNADENKNSQDLKKYFDRWRENAKPTYKSKRISRRRSPNKFKPKNKTRTNKNKKFLRDAFNKWRNISSFAHTRNVLEQIKKSKLSNDNIDGFEKNSNIFPKYKKKVLQVILNIYKTHRNIALKKYFDIWRKACKPKNEYKRDNKMLKYKKKPKIADKDEIAYNKESNKEPDSFNPTYYIPKQNLYYRGPLYNKLNENINEKYIPKRHYNMTNYKLEGQISEPTNNYTTIKNKNIPYIKKYGQRLSDFESLSPNQDEMNYDYYQRYKDLYPNNNLNELNAEENYPDAYDYLQNDKEIHTNKNIAIEENYPYDNNDKDNGQLSDTSSFNESLLNGVTLIQNKKVTKQPRNYTSQSFFIDKNAANDYNKTNNYQLNIKNNKNANQVPMTMKGDFVSLIEQNPKILGEKNPRIQVTNATCDLNQIINHENDDDEDELNDEEVNDEIDKLRNNYIIDKNKVLNKVIQNCDKDLYASQKPFYSKKDQWYSVSIPLNDNEAKWEFLNNIKGERDKNNLNKFELIQKEEDPNKKEENKEDTYNARTFKPMNTERASKKNIREKDNSYKLQEMNFSQFYRSPVHSCKNIFEEEKSKIGNIIRIPRKKRIIRESPSYVGISNSREKIKNYSKNNKNIDRSKGKIEFDPRFKSIQYDDEDDDYNYIDE